MKKILKLLPVALLSTSLLLQGCGANSQQSKQGSKAAVKKISVKNVEEKEPVNVQGRILSNPEDGNFNLTATSQGNWVYYIYTSFGNGDAGLKKFNLNDKKQMDFNKLYYGQYGKTITKDYIKHPRHINVVGNWIFFISDNWICKIKNDGSDFKKLVGVDSTQIPHMIVTKDYIFYDIYDGQFSDLHILNTSDGSEKKCIKGIDSFNIYNNSVYYTCRYEDDNGKGALYEYNLSNDQSNQLLVANYRYGEDFYISDSKIYFISDYLYSADFNSKNIVKLTDDNVNSFLMYKEKIYFINKTNSDKLYSMDLDGKNLKKLDDGDCSYLTILNNRLYYQVKDGNSSSDDKFKTIELDKNK